MSALESLYEDHRHIYVALDAMDVAVRPGIGDGELDAEFFVQAAAFFRDYADGVHHAKEEDLLFPELEKTNLPGIALPLQCMNQEHEAGRALVRRIREAAEGLKGGKKELRGELVVAATQYSGLLRMHANKEDHGLFPASEKILPAPVLEKLAVQFKAIDASVTITIADAAKALTERAARGPAPKRPAPKGTAVPAPPVAYRIVEPPVGADPHLAKALTALSKR